MTNTVVTTRTYVVEEQSRKEMTFTIHETRQDLNGQYTFTATMELSK